MKLYLYLLVMAGVTYLIRMLPLAFFRRKITSPFMSAADLVLVTNPSILYTINVIIRMSEKKVHYKYQIPVLSFSILVRFVRFRIH